MFEYQLFMTLENRKELL